MKTKNILWSFFILFIFNIGCVKTENKPSYNSLENDSVAFLGLQKIDTVFPLIPQPIKIIAYNSFYDINKLNVIAVSNETLLPAANYISKILYDITSTHLQVVVENTVQKNAFNLRLSNLSNNSEQYKLSIAPSEITITGTSIQAIINGINTFRQFIIFNSISSTPSKSNFQCVLIEDKPAFHWRAYMLDVARHFFTKEEVCQTMDMMALLKLNKLHLHLTDDQGWRIPIDKHPEFLETGWKRLPNDHDSLCLAKAKDDPNFQYPSDRWDGTYYFGKYSKSDIKEMIDYGMERGIEIIPEIDIPGHSSIAIKAHNNLACVGKGVGWGKEFSYPLCLGNDSVLMYYKDIFSELMELFPSKYIHVGADEADQTNWTSCPKCQAKISKNNLNSIDGLEHWFLNEIEKIIIEKERKMIVWDDALDVVNPSTDIIWWRDWIGMNKVVGGAIQKGSEVVIANWDVMYFSSKEKNASLSDIYHLSLYPAGITENQKNLVKGIEACTWTETIPNFDRLNYMIYPRLFALSEKAWYGDKTTKKTWNSFKIRLRSWLFYLNSKGISYRNPSL